MARLSHLGGLVREGGEQAFQEAAHRLNHADGRDGHERLHLALLEHLQDVRDVPGF